MIVKAAVRIADLRQNKEIIIPCMRHCDAFYILHEFGYKKNINYKELDQGFIDEKGIFYNRVAAYKHAWAHKQLDEEYNVQPLFSEDLW